MTIDVVVAYVAPGVEEMVPLRLADGASVAVAVAASAIVARLRLDPGLLGFAIFGQRATPATLLADGDRIELTRPLLADAKAVRRQRAKTTPRRAKSSITKPNH